MCWGATWGRRTVLATALAAGLSVTACGNNQGDSDDTTEADNSGASSTTGTTNLPPCDEVGQLVVLSINGFLTLDGEVFNWLNGPPEYVMEVRPGAVELATSYHDGGYHLLYATRGDSSLDVHGTPYDQAIEGWLEAQGFPLDERARLFPEAFERELADQLLTWSSEGGDTYAAYTNNEPEVGALISGGVPRERLYTIGEAGVPETQVLAGDDLTAHLDDLGDLPPACRE